MKALKRAWIAYSQSTNGVVAQTVDLVLCAHAKPDRDERETDLFLSCTSGYRDIIRSKNRAVVGEGVWTSLLGII